MFQMPYTIDICSAVMPRLTPTVLRRWPEAKSAGGDIGIAAACGALLPGTVKRKLTTQLPAGASPPPGSSG